MCRPREITLFSIQIQIMKKSIFLCLTEIVNLFFILNPFLFLEIWPRSWRSFHNLLLAQIFHQSFHLICFFFYFNWLTKIRWSYIMFIPHRFYNVFSNFINSRIRSLLPIKIFISICAGIKSRMIRVNSFMWINFWIVLTRAWYLDFFYICCFYNFITL